MTTLIEIDSFTSFTLVLLSLFVGKQIIARINLLRQYSIPDALVGGVLCAVIVSIIYYLLNIAINFELAARDVLLLYFFAAIGLSTNIRTLATGGRPLIILTILASSIMVLQNFVGMGLAGAFGMDPKAGLLVGSISLTGGVGTTLAWAPYFINVLNIDNALELGLSANMLGLIAACSIGGPIASVLIRRHNISSSQHTTLEVGTLHRDELDVKVDYYGVLLALIWLNITLILGQGISHLISLTGLTLPAFVGCLIGGIFLRALGDLIKPNRPSRLWNYPSMQPALALISDLTLGLFLTMALMGLKFWELQPILGFISITISLQVLLTIVFTYFIVFRIMGKDYEAAVICSGFGGISLGSTATAIANMTAVTQEFGAARRAFIVVPLVCGFSIDLVNALVISVMANF